MSSSNENSDFVKFDTEGELKLAQEIAKIGSWVLNLENNKVYWSEELYKMYGLDGSKPPPPYTEHHKLFTSESWDILSKAVANTAETGDPYELELQSIKQDGSEGWMLAIGKAYKDKNGKITHLRGIAQDISSRKKAERKLEKVHVKLNFFEERVEQANNLVKELKIYRIASKHAESGVFYYDVISNKLTWDDTMHHLFGIDKRDFTGTYDDWEKNLHPDDLERSVKALQNTISTHQDFDQIFRIIHGKTGAIRFIRGKGTVELDEDGKVRALFGTNWDVSKEIKLAEDGERTLSQLKEAQAQLIQSEKMNSLGILTSGVAHEINNPLNYIDGASQLLLNYLNGQETVKKEKLLLYIEWIKNGVERINRIVKSLNKYSSNVSSRTEVCRIHDIIDGCLLFVGNRFQERIAISQNYSKEEFTILGNDAELRQAFLNIIINAIEAIPEKGKISVETFANKKGKVIQITDSGIGIHKDTIIKVVDPFFSTKPPGEGTGLGLFITNSIIKEHGGTLEIESTLTKGTKISLIFPS